ncbi:mechanosensitive ion channel family protein [Parahaliea aestuarii]|uniref:Small-conductance mechanosensitive channel n=1 Tax=Parahaliea aestuarii TaxID=1852021 RepID=A0A5C9A4W3_9GAMM|nr:mechanosensitive ion channel domain-containing protein [Parahaliea aestuarii]TXS94677.1 mechanosensitive ion channel [Parahaliea aestuarii]
MKWLSVAICLATYLLAARAVSATIRRLGRHKEVAEVRVKYLEKTSNILLFVAFVIVLCLILGLGYGQVSLFLSSAFAVIGVALFAQWSILANITASMVIFFGFPYRVGDQIKVTDSDFDLSGTVEEISLFHVLIRTVDGNLITYPNSLILQKPVIKLDRGNTEFPQKIAARLPEPAPEAKTDAVALDPRPG